MGLMLLATFAAGQSETNPVAMAARAALERQARNLTEAAEEMPAEKYDFKPTPQQMSYGALMAHIAKSNEFLCAKLAGRTPNPVSASEADSKERLVAALRASFQACTKDLSALDDTELAQTVTLWGNRPATKATALLVLTNDWADHYATAAIYLRLNRLLPPTAKREKINR